MASSFRVPTLSDPNIVFRIAASQEEICAANRLVYRNYVNLYWPDDEESFHKNKYLNSPARHIFVAVSGSRVLGTMSIIEDSEAGLPSDGFRPEILARYRRTGQRLAEVMSFAVEQAGRQSTTLMLFLIKFLYQYSFHHTELDRLIASCRPKHADFYQERLCFEKLTAPEPHSYAGNVECQLLTLDLLEVHSLLIERYGQSEACDNAYRFLLIDSHPNVRLPSRYSLRRSQHSRSPAPESQSRYDERRIDAISCSP